MTGRPFREALVDLSAIAHNIRLLREAAGGATVLAVVKSNGYGHGAVPIARAALDSGAEWLGVADLTEARELRDAGIDAPLLAWLHAPGQDFEEAVAAGIDIGVSYREQLDRVASTSGTASVQLKVDTGLSRNGADRPQWEELFAAAAEHERRGRLRVRGLWSHLANAGEAEDRAQVEAFERAIELARDAGLTPELLHIASTAAALRRPDARFSMVRLGIGMYGLSPFDDIPSVALGLRPAMELSADIAAVKHVPAGAGVSYDYAHRTAVDSTLALVPIGYGDGIPRSASGGAPVSINGSTRRVAGRIAMDQFVVDLGSDSDAVAVGDRAILFGDPSTGVPSVDDWATAAGTINHEIVCRLGRRIERRYRS